MNKCEIDADGNLILFPESPSEVTLVKHEREWLISDLIEGVCPFCYAPIPEVDKLCNRCLDEIATDWAARHQWRSPSENALRRGILDDYNQFFPRES